MTTFRVPLLAPVGAFCFDVFMMPANPTLAQGITGVLLEIAKPFLFGSFSEVNGLESGTQLEEYHEGGRNQAQRKLLKHGRHPALSFKRGVTPNTDIWDWWYQTVHGKENPVRKNGVVILSDRGGIATQAGADLSPEARAFTNLLPFVSRIPIAIWYFRNGYPERVQGPRLDAKANEVAIETLEIAHEGLIRLGPGMLPGAAGQFAGAVGL